MRRVLLIGSAALSLMALPIVSQAQDAASGTMTNQPAPGQAMSDTASTTMAPALTPEQKMMYDGWSATQRTDYDSWPNDYKVYYWTLTPEQQKGFWALTAEQRAQIYKMTPEQRQMAWNSVIQQMNGQPAPGTMPATPSTPSGPTTPGGMSGDMAGQGGMAAQPGMSGNSTKGNMTAPPASAMNKDYPVCSKTVTDSCRNKGGK